MDILKFAITGKNELKVGLKSSLVDGSSKPRPSSTNIRSDVREMVKPLDFIWTETKLC